MKTIHLGHHFYGAGNLGDDFLLAGFLAAWEGAPGRGSRGAALTCCVPSPREPLARRFPQVDWRPYDEATRRRSIEACDAWLGLGGSPFQSAVSRWFSDHLGAEARWCAAAGKPMFFLGIGGQDPDAYAVDELRAAARQAKSIWTRDPLTAEALVRIGASASRVHGGADLAHVYFADNPPPPARTGRLAAVLNFDYGTWPGLDTALAALARLPAKERVWLAQESRPLPGAERWLFDQLTPAERARWRLQPADIPGASLAETLARWPSAEWMLSSRFHATLAAAWAGSRAVVIGTNAKLAGVAKECGYPLLEPSADPAGLAEALQAAVPPDQAALAGRAAAARHAVDEFAAAIT